MYVCIAIVHYCLVYIASKRSVWKCLLWRRSGRTSRLQLLWHGMYVLYVHIYKGCMHKHTQMHLHAHIRTHINTHTHCLILNVFVTAIPTPSMYLHCRMTSKLVRLSLRRSSLAGWRKSQDLLCGYQQCTDWQLLKQVNRYNTHSSTGSTSAHSPCMVCVCVLVPN